MSSSNTENCPGCGKTPVAGTLYAEARRSRDWSGFDSTASDSSPIEDRTEPACSRAARDEEDLRAVEVTLDEACAGWRETHESPAGAVAELVRERDALIPRLSTACGELLNTQALYIMERRRVGEDPKTVIERMGWDEHALQQKLKLNPDDCPLSAVVEDVVDALLELKRTDDFEECDRELDPLRYALRDFASKIVAEQTRAGASIDDVDLGTVVELHEGRRRLGAFRVFEVVDEGIRRVRVLLSEDGKIYSSVHRGRALIPATSRGQDGQ